MYRIKTFDLEIPQRTDFEIEIEVVDHNDKPVAINGSTASFLVAAGVSDQSPVVVVGTITDATNGKYLVTLSDDQTNLTGKKYGEAFLLGPTGNRSVVARGSIDFIPTNQGG